jgi:hypothetical protein
LRLPFVAPVLLFVPTTGKLDPRKSGEARRYTALCGGSQHMQTRREGRICIRMSVRFYEGTIQVILAEAGSGESLDRNLDLHVEPPVFIFADIPPEQDFLQVQ